MAHDGARLRRSICSNRRMLEGPAQLISFGQGVGLLCCQPDGPEVYVSVLLEC